MWFGDEMGSTEGSIDNRYDEYENELSIVHSVEDACAAHRM
jgi:hypothetical protein